MIKMNQKMTNFDKKKETNLSNLVLKMLSSLNQRTKNIITKRFGLDGNEKQTLEEIGKVYHITRERVRQIESATMREFKKSNKIELAKPFEEALIDLLREHGGAMEYENLTKAFKEKFLDSKLHANHLEFILKLSPRFIHIVENEETKKGWALKETSLELPKKIIKNFCDILEYEKRPLPEDHAVTVTASLDEVKKAEEVASNRKAILSYLNLSKRVLKNPFNEWGFSHWKEVVPKGIKDKSYLVLKKTGKPLHFREITDLINEKGFSKRTANAQTVHNELIKDKRFVLVGRGIYALVEWGYKPGTVCEVVEMTLRENKTPLSREEIVDRVLKQRKVKKNTIILALQNKDKFQRVKEGMYKLVE